MAAKQLGHRLDHVVGTDSDALAKQLHREMPVAEVPGDPHHVGVVVRVDFGEPLRTCRHRDHAAAVEQQPIAVAKPRRLWQVEQDLATGLGHQQDAAAMAAVIVHQHTVHCARGVPGLSRQQRAGAQLGSRDILRHHTVLGLDMTNLAQQFQIIQSIRTIDHTTMGIKRHLLR